MQTGDHVSRNLQAWSGYAADFVEPARRFWASDEPTWGVFGIPESRAGLFPDHLGGKDVVELGCGTAYVSAWLARRGAKPVGVDLTPEQLATARALQREHGLSFPLVRADAERAPLASGTFDIAISEYGASIWCDPYRWIPEAARLLRPGGDLVFLKNSALIMLCVPDLESDGAATERLRRDYFGMHRFAWPDSTAVEFHLAHGDMIRLLRDSGFEVLDLIELQPAEGATTRYDFVTPEWARRWPAEEVWKARKR